MNMRESADHENMLSAVRVGANGYTIADVDALCAIAVAGALKGREIQDAALRKDAERYRWLRGGKARTTGAPKRGRIEVYQWEDKSEGSLLKGRALDAAIDAAMAAASCIGAA
jgi:hypothetical protein